MRIGYLMQNGAPNLKQVSGSQLHTLAIIDTLKKLGHVVRTVAIQGGELSWSDDVAMWSLPKYGLTRQKWFRLLESLVRRIQYELRLPFLGLFDSLHYADACFHQLKGFDVLYERHGYMGYGGIIASRLLRIPLVLELNGNIIKEIDELGLNMSCIQRRLGRWITVRTFLAADSIVVVSSALKRMLVDDLKIPGRKISIVVNGVNINLYSRRYDERMTRSQYGIGDGPVVAFVGSFQPWHGVDLLVESFEIVGRQIPNSQMVIVGDGFGRDKAEAQVAKLGLTNKVLFLGRLPQDKVAAVLSVAKVAVAPYPFEHDDIVGTPLKLLEYMASGKGIVASTASIHEIVNDGITGLRVLPGNVKALADGILRLLMDDQFCTKLGENAARLSQQYSWDSVTGKLVHVLSKAREIELEN